MDLEILNTTIVNSIESYKGCISIKDGKIAAITKNPLNMAKHSIDASGLHLVPGMIDQHVHFMDPGDLSREDFINGSSAAAVSGVTTVVEHTHSKPVRDINDFKEKLDYLSNRSIVDYGLTAHVFPEDIGHLKELWDAGVTKFKVFTCTTHGIPTLNNYQLFNLLNEIASFNGTCLIHCEDDAITEGNEIRLKELNRSDNEIISEWRSETAEEVAVANVSFMARLTGAKVIIAHVSHPLVIDLIERERKEGANIYSEVCPQYLFLDSEVIKKEGALAKFTPPARTTEQADEMIDLLNNGNVSILSSDHAPSTIQQKLSKDIWDCNFGLPGIDTTFKMMLNLINKNRLTLNRIVEIYSESPAKLLGLYPRKGAVRVGADADLALVDLSKKWRIKNDGIISKAGWSPYDGYEGIGETVKTFVRGRLVADNGKVVVEPGIGKPINRQ